MEKEFLYEWRGWDEIIASRSFGIKLDYIEMNKLMRCSCEWPNFLDNKCQYCGRNFNEIP